MRRIAWALVAILVPVQSAEAVDRDVAALNSTVAAPSERGMFVGATIRLSGRQERKPETIVALRMAGMTSDPGSLDLAIGKGLELGVTGSGKVEMRLDGRPTSDTLGRRSNMSTAGAIAIGLGVAALVGGVIVGARIIERRNSE